jgi:RND family efflux transporter MFP subunit
MTRVSIAALLAATVLAACGKGVANAPAAAPQALLLAPEDVATVQLSARALGPVITGSIQPERRADLRAEIGAVVLQALKDNGEPVRRGELLVRLDDSAIRDNLASAQESARAVAQALEQAERQLQRLKALQAQGMTSLQALEDAEVRRNNAQSDLIAARARVAAASQQLARTEVRAPFDGVVSERKASAGDTAQVGKELVKVIDPRSMRFEGLVSADRMHEIKPGQKVVFRVNGFPGTDFTGQIKRVDATANATTRQVEVQVAFGGNGDLPRVAGLYAEGRIETGSAQVLMLPESAVMRALDEAHAWRVGEGSLNKVTLKLGERDERIGEVVVTQGLVAGERYLRRPSGTLTDGQKFEWLQTAAVAATSSTAAASSAKR